MSLDDADVLTDRILAVGSDALLHLGCAETGIAPGHGHHRNVDLWNDVRSLTACDDAREFNPEGKDR